jgi:hypothetical protein
MNKPAQPRRNAAQPQIAINTRISPEADTIRRRLECEMRWTGRQVVEEALKALDHQLRSKEVGSEAHA